MNKSQLKTAGNVLVYMWATAMCIVILVAIGKVVYETEYAWIGVILALLVLIATKGTSIVTMGTKRAPKTKKRNEF
jgi:hypothetical protein